MKASVHSLDTAPMADRSWLSVYCDLIKARLTFLVLLTAAVGFYVGSPGSLNWGRMLHLLGGTGLLACGAAALNQLWEREFDARMRRTQNRPLPSGRLQPDTVLLVGGGCAV